MSVEKITGFLNKNDWNNNVNIFVRDQDALLLLQNCSFRMARWTKEIRSSEPENPAICFIIETLSSCQMVATLISIGLYKNAVGAMRIMFESALYYSYFRSHHEELETLVKNPEYFISKKDIILYHKRHTPNYDECGNKFGLNARIEAWYSKVSAVIHGQRPDKWPSPLGMTAVTHNKDEIKIVLDMLREGEEIIHFFLISSVGRRIWSNFSPAGKRELLKGLAPEVRGILGLDRA